MNALRQVAVTIMCIAAVASAAGVASAHECFNASRAARANAAIAQHSHGWSEIHTSQFLAILLVSCAQQPSGDCPPPPPIAPSDVAALQSGDFEALVGEILGFAPRGAAVTNLLAFTQKVEDEAACLGVPTHFLTLSNATAGAGAEKKGGKSLSDGRGIDHFPEVYGERIFTAYGTVLGGGPSACH